MERRFAAARLASEDRRFPQAPPAHRAEARVCGCRENTGTSEGVGSYDTTDFTTVSQIAIVAVDQLECVVACKSSASRALRSCYCYLFNWVQLGTAMSCHVRSLPSGFVVNLDVPIQTHVAGDGEPAHVRRALLRYLQQVWS